MGSQRSQRRTFIYDLGVTRNVNTSPSLMVQIFCNESTFQGRNSTLFTYLYNYVYWRGQFRNCWVSKQLFFVDMELRKCISKLIPDGYFLTHISSAQSLPCLQKSCFETTKFLNCPLYHYVCGYGTKTQIYARNLK